MPDGVPKDNPLTSQLLKYSFNRPETLDRIKPIRELVNQYPGVVTLGEVTLCEDTIELASQYSAGDDRLHLAYQSSLLVDKPLTADLMQGILGKVANHFLDGGTCWIVGNHDYGRLRSRWTGKDIHGNPYPDEFYHMIAALLLSLPGAFCLWQGDELGLPVASIPGDIDPEDIKDPFGKALYPDVKGRDGSRTPMPWTPNPPCAGFTTAPQPWLPVPDSHLNRSVQHQHRHHKSLLNSWRRLLHWRKNQPALEAGKLDQLEVKDTILAFSRYYAEHHLLCLFNLSDEAAHYDLSQCGPCEAVRGLEFDFSLDGNEVVLAPYGVFYGQLQGEG
jgi:alpha-glucosidase